MKPIHWVGRSKKDLENLPVRGQHAIRAALFSAQTGRKVDYAKQMHGDLREAMEIASNDRNGTFRDIYYVGKEFIYAIYFFQKKSKLGIKTPKTELDLIRSRLTWARRQERETG